MRIASLQPSITITLKHLGRLDTLCACTKYCVEALPELAKMQIPILHDSWTANTEEILATKPEIVLASVPYRMESLAAMLKAGLPLLTFAPSSLADIDNDTRILANLVNAQAAGERILTRMSRVLKETRATAAKAKEKPLVYCEEWGKPLIHSQGWVAELVEAAGGRFLGTPGAHITPDEIAAANPDILIFAWCGAGDRVPLARLIEQRHWQSLNAVKERNVYCVPDEYLNTPAITLLDGLASLAGAIHPQLFPLHQRLIRLA